jgi:hypothetical protein
MMTAKLAPSIVLPILTGACVVLAALACPTIAHAQDDCPMAIQVSPGTLNLDRTGDAVTIHADIAFSLVNQVEVRLYIKELRDAWIVPLSCFADDVGYLVARFSTADVELLDSEHAVLDLGTENKFSLHGSTLDGTPFCGIDDGVRVVRGGLKAGRGD